MTVVLKLAGLPFDRALRAHRLLGRGMAILTALHFIASVVDGSISSLSRNAVGRFGVVPLYGTIAGVAVLLISIFSIGPFRRKLYDQFLWFHRIMASLCYIFTALHINGGAAN